MKKKALLLLILFGVSFLALLPIRSAGSNPAYEDFTTYTELDPDTRINKTVNHIDFISRKDEDAWLQKFKGIDYFGSVFEHFLEVKLIEASSIGDFACVWALSDELYNIDYWRDFDISYYFLCLYNSAGNYRILLEEKNNGWDHHSDYGSISLNTWYYLRIVKKTTSLQCKIYSTSALRDIGGVPDIDTLSLTVTDNSFRRIFACITLNDGASLQAEVDIENFELRDRIIEYDSVNNIITCLGATETDPISFYEVWLANDIGQWNVVNNTCNTQFKFWCFLQIGDGSITTWFADETKQIMFDSTIFSANYQACFAVKNNAHLRFGVLVDATNKIGQKGVDFYAKMRISESGYIMYLSLIGLENGGDARIYGSHFIGDSDYKPFRFSFSGHADVYDVLFEGINEPSEIIITGNANVDLFDLILIKARITPSSDTATLEINKISMYNVNEGIKFLVYYGGNLSNLYARNIWTYMFYCQDISDDHYLINCDLEKWTFNWVTYGAGNIAEVYRQYTFNLAIFFPNGTVIQNANVTISNDYLGSSDSWLTFANGSIPMQIYSMGHYNQTGGNNIYSYNPYNITVTFEGYETYKALINIESKHDLKICLCELKPSYGLGLGSGFILALIISLALLVSIVAIQRKRS